MIEILEAGTGVWSWKLNAGDGHCLAQSTLFFDSPEQAERDAAAVLTAMLKAEISEEPAPLV